MTIRRFIIITLMLAIVTFCLGGYFLLTSIYQGWLSSFPELTPERIASLQLKSTVFFFSGLALILGSPALSIYLIFKKKNPKAVVK